eukprot:CAMPEP_0204373510 /NCGR_PEP_ID=MMETSP0469-20131031/48093_1 /ASSEMBLY_ACC=CAM_ASM_000384 /TAXON_ID=2969 /ORGANISM="Oxyrrhis marina" /LENGTH=56 /DNA_ID=CAMNT_0051363997 /DNA_START=75 /DNA_END=242 /DNA_ORIENTATION=-
MAGDPRAPGLFPLFRGEPPEDRTPAEGSAWLMPVSATSGLLAEASGNDKHRGRVGL